MRIWPWSRIADLEQALLVCRQALFEVRHAQECGAEWYTKGASGLHQQVRMWVRRGLEAITKSRPSEGKKETHD